MNEGEAYVPILASINYLLSLTPFENLDGIPVVAEAPRLILRLVGASPRMVD